jgi:hypothetical protein
MRASERESLRQRFQFSCGYCGVREGDVGAELTVDHYQPTSRGGLDEVENRVYCCHACNEFKGDYWEPSSSARILHPLHDNISANLLEEADGTLRPLTETGAFHLKRLYLNRPQLVTYRRERRLLLAARQAEARLIEALSELDERVRRLIDELDTLRSNRSDE